MSIANFVPEFWSTRLLRHLDANLVFASPQLVNRDYQGEIAQAGDTVNIQKIGSPSIVNYVKGTPMTPERPTGTTQALTIDRDKGFYIQMDDLDAVQANVDLFDQFVERAGVEMAEVVDADVAARMVAGAGVSLGTDAAPVVLHGGSPTYSSFYRFVLECRRRLGNNNAPGANRWLVLNPDLETLALDDSRFIPAGASEQRTGLLGRIADFDILSTTAVPTSPGSGGSPVPNFKVCFGAGNYGTSVATQFVATEAERLQGLFEDAVKGRNAWGAKVIESTTVGVAHVDQPF